MKLLPILISGVCVFVTSCNDEDGGAEDVKEVIVSSLSPFRIDNVEEDIEPGEFPEIYSRRRAQILNLKIEDLGEWAKEPVWAVVMELGLDEITSTVITSADGTAIEFGSSGVWAMETVEHPYVKAASLNLLKKAEGFFVNMKKVDEFPRPTKYGDIRAYVVTPKGVFTYSVEYEKLREKQHFDFRKLWNQSDELQSQLRIVEEKRRAEQGRLADLHEPQSDSEEPPEEERPVNLEELVSLIKTADRIVVEDTPMEKKVLFESAEKSDIEALTEALTIEKNEGWFHCMCVGTMAVKLYKENEVLTYITNHHGSSIRCSLWDSDADIDDTGKWLAWFDQRGMPELRNEIEENRARVEKSDKAELNWLENMPLGMRPAWEGSYGQDGVVDVNPLRKSLVKSYPTKREQILALLHWFGSGSEPWRQGVQHEFLAGKLLDGYDAAEIISALAPSKMSKPQIAGAVRFITDLDYPEDYPEDYPKDLKRALWEKFKDTSDEEKRKKAKYLLE